MAFNTKKNFEIMALYTKNYFEIIEINMIEPHEILMLLTLILIIVAFYIMGYFNGYDSATVDRLKKLAEITEKLAEKCEQNKGN